MAPEKKCHDCTWAMQCDCDSIDQSFDPDAKACEYFEEETRPLTKWVVPPDPKEKLMNCKNCAWFEPAVRGLASGWCHRYPPPPGHAERTGVDEDEFCGEFKKYTDAPEPPPSVAG